MISAHLLNDGTFGWTDDGDHGLGKYLFRILEEKNLKNAILFVTREYGGVHIGYKRFEIILQLVNQLIRQIRPQDRDQDRDNDPQRRTAARGRNGNNSNRAGRRNTNNVAPPPYAQVMNLSGNAGSENAMDTNDNNNDVVLPQQEEDQWANTGAVPRRNAWNVTDVAEDNRSAHSTPDTPTRGATAINNQPDTASRRGSTNSTSDVGNQRDSLVSLNLTEDPATEGRQM
jgi:hypothetical protein